MNSLANQERGFTPENTGGGVVIPARFYKPDSAASLLALRDGFVAGNAVVPAWVRGVRDRGAVAVAERGLPHVTLERWKYSNLPMAVKDIVRTIAPQPVAVNDPAGVVRGITDSDADWLGADVPADAQYGDMMLWHLSDAFLADAVVVDIPVDKTVDQPVTLHVTGADGQFAAPRLAVRLAAGASLTIIEHHSGTGRYWANAAAQIELGAGATLHHYRIQDHAPEAVYTQSSHIRLGEGARYEAVNISSGASFSRNQVHVTLAGAQAHATLNAVNLLRGAQVGDNTFLIEHIAPDCTSSQMVRSVLDDRARGVFQGKVHVHRTGQRTDGYQLCNSLILSEGAEMDTKPELEIYADDVKCSHGATIGQVDEEALFYLRSRGIPAGAARALLIEGFLAEVLEAITDEQTHETALLNLRDWLNKIA